MINAILGQKINQTQVFDTNGNRLTVTNVLTDPCFVVGVKTMEKDHYRAVQLGFGIRRVKTVSKPQLGIIKKAGLDKNPPRFLKEIRIDEKTPVSENIKPGLSLNAAEIFKQGDLIKVAGVSKGKGFQGVVKRHHFKGGLRTHGQSDRERAPGSIGSTTTPGRVYKGKRMAGRMGQDRITIKNLKVVNIDPEKNILSIAGLVPGGRNSLLIIQKLES